MNFLGCPPPITTSWSTSSRTDWRFDEKLHRSELRAFPASFQFEATLDKMNTLCDGISYLLLQRVVDGF